MLVNYKLINCIQIKLDSGTYCKVPYIASNSLSPFLLPMGDICIYLNQNQVRKYLYSMVATFQDYSVTQQHTGCRSSKIIPLSLPHILNSK